MDTHVLQFALIFRIIVSHSYMFDDLIISMYESSVNYMNMELLIQLECTF